MSLGFYNFRSKDRFLTDILKKNLQNRLYRCMSWIKTRLNRNQKKIRFEIPANYLPHLPGGYSLLQYHLPLPLHHRLLPLLPQWYSLSSL